MKKVYLKNISTSIRVRWKKERKSGCRNMVSRMLIMIWTSLMLKEWISFTDQWIKSNKPQQQNYFSSPWVLLPNRNSQRRNSWLNGPTPKNTECESMWNGWESETKTVRYFKFWTLLFQQTWNKCDKLWKTLFPDRLIYTRIFQKMARQRDSLRINFWINKKIQSYIGGSRFSVVIPINMLHQFK